MELNKLCYDKLQQLFALLNVGNVSIFLENINKNIEFYSNINASNVLSLLKKINTKEICYIIILDGNITQYQDELSLLKSKKIRFFAEIDLIEDVINVLIDNSQYEELFLKIKKILKEK